MIGEPRIIKKKIGEEKWIRIVLFLALFCLGLVMMVPFIWMISTSFEKTANIMIPYPPRLLPETFSTFNYKIAIKSLNIFLLFSNSGIVSIASVAIQLLIASLAAYAFAKGSFPGKNVLFLAVLATLMIPIEATLIPMYFLMRALRLYDTLWALIVPHLCSAFAVFFIVQYMKTIPDDLLDAGRIDGCSELRLYWQIAIPLCKPALATVTFLTFLASWNSLIWPLIMITDPQKYTMPIGLAFFQMQFSSAVGMMMSGVTISLIPLLVIYCLLQKYIIRGIAITGLKE